MGASLSAPVAGSDERLSSRAVGESADLQSITTHHFLADWDPTVPCTDAKAENWPSQFLRLLQAIAFAPWPRFQVMIENCSISARGDIVTRNGGRWRRQQARVRDAREGTRCICCRVLRPWPGNDRQGGDVPGDFEYGSDR